jgi:hypothetical protein
METKKVHSILLNMLAILTDSDRFWPIMIAIPARFFYLGGGVKSPIITHCQ